MIVIPFRAEHFWAIEPQEAQSYVWDSVTPAQIKELESLNSFTVMNDAQPVACFGWIEQYPHRATLWAMMGNGTGKHFVGFTRIAKLLLNSLPHKRVEFEVDCEFEQGHRWARMLGFTLEAERLRGYRMDGGDSAIYARVQ